MMQTFQYFHLDARGFMTSHGQPDCSRASRYVLKDYVMVSCYVIATSIIDQCLCRASFCTVSLLPILTNQISSILI